MKNVLIVGATSAIAIAIAKLYARRGDTLYLVARDAERLEQTAEDLRARGAAEIHTATADALDTAGQQKCVEQAVDTLGELDLVLLAYGTLPDQEECQGSIEASRIEFETYALSAIILLTQVADIFERQGKGTIAVITSVAGDRGRQSNYVYGAAKGAVSLFLQGLRNRLHASGVTVATIKPGFVDTPMTAQFEKGPLWASPDTVANTVVRGLDRKANVIYAPGFWRYIMLVIRLVPESIFKRLKL
ncbi:MAG: SDR family oxidoreductase [Pseudomonadota bacterium]